MLARCDIAIRHANSENKRHTQGFITLTLFSCLSLPLSPSLKPYYAAMLYVTAIEPLLPPADITTPFNIT